MSPPKPTRFRFEVALSFAGDRKRPQLRTVSDLLRRELGSGKVFFDEWFEAELAGHDAHHVLQKVYLTSTRLVVSCICKRYAEKPWTQEEWRAIQVFERRLRPGSAAGSLTDRNRFLPLRFGDGEVDGLFETALVPDVRDRTPEQIADLILERLRLVKSRRPRRAAARTSSVDSPGETLLPGRLWEVPPLPFWHQPRTEHVAIKMQLLSSAPRDVVLHGHSVRHTVDGMAGVGKSVLAAAIARDPDVMRAFPDGIFWVSLGQTPGDIRALQARLCRALGQEVVGFGTEAEGRSALTKLFSNRRCLLVLDDVWEGKSARWFDAVGSVSRLLVTTRKKKVAHELRPAQETCSIAELGHEQAVALLARCAGIDAEKQLPPEASAIAEECGALPLALAMVGAALKGRPLNRWKTQLQRLKNAGLMALEATLPEYRDQASLIAALELSIDELSPRSRERYLDLAVFPEDALIAEATLHTYWAQDGLDEGDVQDLVDDLVDRALVRRDDQGRVFLHDLQRDYMRVRVKDMVELDRRLVKAYRSLSPEGLHSVPNDGYFFRFIVEHLLRAEGPAAVRELLFDVRWLRAKLAATKATSALLCDFDLLPSDAAAGLVQGVLRATDTVLNRNPSELGAQLLARLSPDDAPELHPMIEAVRASIGTPAIVPLRPTLTVAHRQLHTFERHSDRVSSVALSADGRRALSGSYDQTLKLWDTDSGALLRTFQGHSHSVNSVALSADGRRALSGCSYQTLKLWDTDSGALLRTFEGHSSSVNCVALSADGRRALSGSWDQTLKLWDTESGALLHTLDDHASLVISVALSADGCRALAGFYDKALKLWDAESGTLLRRLEGHSLSVSSVALSADGRRALSGSGDQTLKLWDTNSGALLRTFEAHSSYVHSVALSADGRQALSASGDRTLKLWDTDGGALRGHFTADAGVTAVAFNAPQSLAIVGDSLGGMHAFEIRG